MCLPRFVIISAQCFKSSVIQAMSFVQPFSASTEKIDQLKKIKHSLFLFHRAIVFEQFFHSGFTFCMCMYRE